MKLSRKCTAGILTAGMIISSVGLGGCTKNYTSAKNAKDSLVVTIGDEKIYMDQVKPYILFEESNGQLTSCFYQMYNIEEDYWTSEDDDGKTTADTKKEEILNSVIENNILYSEAMKAGGYEVDDATKEAFKTNAQTLIDTMSEDEIKKTGFTVDDFVDYQEKVYVAEKYKQDIKDGFNVTTDDFADDEDYDYETKYKAYETSYIRVPITTTDDSGNTTDLTDDEKSSLESIMKEIRTKIEDGSTFDEAVTDYTSYGVESSTFEFTVEDYNSVSNVSADGVATDGTDEEDTSSATDETATDSSEDAESTDSSDADSSEDEKTPTDNASGNESYIKTMYFMQEDYLSDVFQADGYYYIAEVTDDDSHTALDSALATAVTEKEDSMFDDYLDKLKDGDYKCTVNDKVWDSITLGDNTIIPDEISKALNTLENPAKSDD